MIHRLARIAALTLGTLAVPVLAADDLDRLQNLGQAQFRLLSEDLGAALSYKAVVPAEPLGTTGFDIGVGASTTRLESINAYSQAFSGNAPERLVVPKVYVQKGLPFGIDLGAFLAGVPDSNIKLWGAELRYAIVKGGPATPAVAVRGSYSSLQGVSQLKLDNTGLDLSVSKGFAFFTPYLGAGKVWTRSSPDAGTGLQGANFDQNKVFVGLNVNLGFVNIAAEGDKTGDANSYSLKFGWRF